MPNWVDGVIVGAIAIGASVLVGILGYLIDKSEGKSEGDQSGPKSERVQPGKPAEQDAEVKRV